MSVELLLWELTFNMGKGTEGPSRTAATLLHVITLGGFIDLGDKTHLYSSLLSPGVVCTITAETDPPLDGTAVLFSCGSTDIPLLPHIYWDLPILHSVSLLDMAMLCGDKNPDLVKTRHTFIHTFHLRSRHDKPPVFVLVRAAPPVFAVMVIWTGIPLATQTRWLLTELCLVVGQHVVVICGDTERNEAKVPLWSSYFRSHW